MKRIIPIVLAAAAFVVVLLLLSHTPEQDVLVASRDLPQGHTINESDYLAVAVPEDIAPFDAIQIPDDMLGMTLSIGRSEGDIFRQSNLAEEPMALAPNERAVAITVNNASGLAGLLKTNDLVGVTAVIEAAGLGERGTYSKAAVENLRVIYLSPDFQAVDPADALVTTTTDNTTATTPKERKPEGALVLAVPIAAETIVYEFKDVEPSLGRQQRVANVIELLTALEASENAKLFLHLMPRNSEEMITSGLWLPELIIKPYKPTPTFDPNMLESLLQGTPIVIGDE